MMRLVLLLLLVSVTCGAAPTYVGSESCKDCHAEQYQAWQASDHHGAMQAAEKPWVLGDFNNVTVEFNGVTSRFFMRDSHYWVNTDSADGKLKDYPVAYALGVYPLQQYVIDTGQGRYQILTIAWDARPAAEGGQRWFHLQTAEDAVAGSPLHWTGTFYNWNSRCATCHTTNFKKNYQRKTKRYQSHYDEVTVGCEACHGPASDHLAWTKAPDTALALKGFMQSLDDKGLWAMPEKGHIMQRVDGQNPTTQVTQCAHCHSRRQQITEAPHGQSFLDHHQSQFLAQGLYYPDGQIQDEVFVYDSFLQSKMHAKGVVCSNCHNPHSGKLRAPGNGVCLQCHKPERYNVTEHHHHPAGSAGAQCANCHMPETTYMVVDPRRDHSIRIPRPDLSKKLTTPNACNQCHDEKTTDWASDAFTQWWGAQPAHWGQTMAQARAGDAAVLPELLTLANSQSLPAIVRASLLQQAAAYPSADTYQTALQQLHAAEPEMRIGAIRALAFLPPNSRAPLYPLMTDPVKAVRLALALPMAEIPEQQMPVQYQKSRQTLITEFIEVQLLQADTPSAQVNLGSLYLMLGDAVMAEAAFNEALRITPAFLPALLNLADLQRQTGRDTQGGELLMRAVEVAPEDANAQHALGLYFIRQKNLAQALMHLNQAARLSPENIRFGYVYAVALYSAGKKAEAIAALRQLKVQAPDNREVNEALRAYGG